MKTSSAGQRDYEREWQEKREQDEWRRIEWQRSERRARRSEAAFNLVIFAIVMVNVATFALVWWRHGIAEAIFGLVSFVVAVIAIFVIYVVISRLQDQRRKKR